MTLAEQILASAQKSQAIIATAESCTGGMVSAAITDVPGSSAVFDRGFVTYTNAAKTDMLGVSTRTLESVGAVSEEVAREMAIGAIANSTATLSVSITGIAGPGGSDHKPEGRVCFGLATRTDVHTETKDFGALGRDSVRKAARDHALNLLLRALSPE
ncbi:nicotinamide-nucleotide amidase [Cognatiyoonia koreensis]|uniref:Nicotinamide-nucleotide amidase n=1 Tax=Cognatiyoonia koreensis TaxID=364200 RepID=A0A1I0P295_9RHOB|nr:CinA family protein [Cognatiyoonia koreensis]SEW08471.1 nicotinamide-nucleotide amidase [Cognatiyoonia koreensis]